ncbi:MAG: lysostaphin resistance A-like protein [Vulcanimicrobiaceae bacterium]
MQRSPSSPRSWAADAFPVWGSLAAAIGGIIVYLFTLVLLLRGFHVTPQNSGAPQLTPAIVKAQVLGYIPILGYMAIVLPLLARRSLGELLGTLGAAEIFNGFGGAVAMWLVVIGIGAIEEALFGKPPEQNAIRLFQNSQPGLWLNVMAIVAVTLAPFVEELVFRGFIFNALWRRFPFAVSAIISGLIFGAAHGQAAGILPLAGGGIVLAAVYARTGSLWSSMITHGSFNAITLTFLLLAQVKKA